MALVLRQTKGAALTFTELDGNFTYLSQSIATSGNYFTLSGANVTTVYGGSFSGAVTASAIYTPGIVIGSQGKFSLSGNNTTPLNIIGNSTSSNASQLQIQGYTNNNQSLLIGYNTTSSYASIQSLTQGSTYNPLVINPSGGNVGINKFSPSASLDVYGNTLITGSLGVTGSFTLVGNQIITGSSTSTLGYTGSLFGTASYSNSPIAITGSSIYSNTLTSNINPNYSILLGQQSGYGIDAGSNYINAIGWYAGYQTTGSIASNYIGFQAGYQVSSSQISNYIGYQAGYQTIGSTYSNFLGYGTGYQASGSYYSNYIGFQAGYQASGSYYSNYIGVNAGYQASGSYDSNFIGQNAGYSATGSYYSNYIGVNAGYQASGSYVSNFIGVDAGQYSQGNYQSSFIGYYTGQYSSGSYNSNFIGYSAGQYVSGSYYSNFIGAFAGAQALGSYNSNFIGSNTGYQASGSYYSNFIGNGAGYQASSSNYSNFIGASAGYQASNSPFSNFIGYQAGNSTTNLLYGNFIGYQAGQLALYTNNSNFIGFQAGYNATYASASNFIGLQAGLNAYSSSNSNFIGQQAGYQVTSSQYTNLLGYKAGYAPNTNLIIGDNNTIIGTNITLPTNYNNGINIGGLIFGSGSYSTTTGNPSSGSAGGKIGINQPNPQYNLDVSGSGNFTGAVTATSFTGSTALVNGITTINTNSAGNYALAVSNTSTTGVGINMYLPFSTSPAISVNNTVGQTFTVSNGGNINTSGNIVASSFTGSLLGSSSYAATSSYANNFTVAGTLTAQTIVVQTITSSIDYSSGSNIFGNSLSNTQTFTGSINATGSLNLTGSLNVSLSGSFGGNVTALGFYNSSDINLKNISSAPIDNLSNIKNIDTISYTWKDKTDDKIHYGHSAQQVEKYYPELVITKEDGYKSLNYTELHTLQIAQLQEEIQRLTDIISDITFNRY